MTCICGYLSLFLSCNEIPLLPRTVLVSNCKLYWILIFIRFYKVRFWLGSCGLMSQYLLPQYLQSSFPGFSPDSYLMFVFFLFRWCVKSNFSVLVYCSVFSQFPCFFDSVLLWKFLRKFWSLTCFFKFLKSSSFLFDLKFASINSSAVIHCNLQILSISKFFSGLFTGRCTSWKKNKSPQRNHKLLHS